MTQPQQSPGGTDLSLRRWVPPPALAGFLVLLGLMFCLSYVIGASAGPVAPGMRSSGTGATPDSGSPGPHGHSGAGGTRTDGAR
ncbi:hypothetical protein OG429_33150 [Streptomyces sp. NBC_00190]|uniref:hypothetical protein n=1 Tax=unclassified Streptomyces TaxID=2593676 RepID=UPI002E28E6BA|nr:hypothetical protein [Streptomyces sp. NBC_00190]WSZ43701.1 hypothetical protein OG239_35605 [Streptomyces sp. NBC_00868]